MERLFRDLTHDELEQPDWDHFVQLGASRGSTWTELLQSDRILIVCEAGAGKTFECKKQQQTLSQRGEAAFFLELATLADTPVEQMLLPEEEQRLQAWRSAQAETATFFLDSIDELKLTLHTFRQALVSLRKAIGAKLGFARIVVTSRPVRIDLELFRELLPIPDADGPATAEAFADVVAKGRIQDAKETPPRWRSVALLPLNTDQIVEIARDRGVDDPQTLLAEINRANAGDFVRRPMDLIELCAHWQDHRRIGSHRDQVESNVHVKLAPSPDRSESAALSPEKALDGASRLALAAMLTRRPTLRHSAAADVGSAGQPALDPSKLLHDWTTKDREALLERPLFSFASYGRVRFHHRSVTEYLAGGRIVTLLGRGVSVRTIRRLLFTTTAQGERVVKPSMRAVAAWAALADDGIFEEVRRWEPSTLLAFGDPGSLRLDRRTSALRAFVKAYGAGGWRGLDVPWEQVRRFASADLAPEIQRLWDEGIENPEVRELLLNLIEAGKVMPCADIAHAVATDAAASYGERVAAIDALAILDDSRLAAIADSMATEPDRWSTKLVRRAALRLFPQHLSVGRFCALLDRISGMPGFADTVGPGFADLVEQSELNDEDLGELRIRLTGLVSEGLAWTTDWPPIVSPRKSFAPILAAACLSQLRRRRPTAEVDVDVVRSSVVVLRLRDDDDGSDKVSKALRQALNDLPSNGRKAVFQADDALVQRLRPQPDPAKRFREAAFNGPLWLLAQKDWGWVVEMLADQTLAADTRAVALEAAMHFWDRTGSRQAYLIGLRPHVEDCLQLVATLDAAIEDAEHDLQPAEPQVRPAGRRETIEQRERQARESWRCFWEEVSSRPDDVFADDHAKNTAWNLWQAMERSSTDGRESGWNRRFIERHFGKPAADRLRTTLMMLWRRMQPTLPSERRRTGDQQNLREWRLGVVGLTAEAEDRRWTDGLGPEEVRLALRYTTLVHGSLPAWLEDLATAHPSIVEEVLGGELSLDIDEPAPSSWQSATLSELSRAPRTVASLFVPRLECWLRARLAHSAEDEKRDTGSRLEEVTRFLLRHGDEPVRARLLATARDRLADGVPGGRKNVWLPVMLTLDPESGIDVLERELRPLPVEARGDAVLWFASLFGEQHGGLRISLSRYAPGQLLRLARLAYRWVRPADDAVHESAYSPDDRDDAERARGSIVNTLLKASGQDGWNAKVEMSRDPLFEHFSDRCMALARESSAEEADGVAAADEAAVLALDRQGELPPATRDDMFALLVDRLDDLEEALLRDDSPRAEWAGITDESIMRRGIARELRHAARSAYTVAQESVTADQKETDIRLQSNGSDQQAVIELKVGEKERSGAELRATLMDQLVTKYMAAPNCRAGCLLITSNGKRGWQHPDTGEMMELPGLIAMLNEEAKRIEQRMGGALRLVARGLDLRPRLGPERSKK